MSYLPPTMNVNVPAAAPPTPPDTGASIIRSCPTAPSHTTAQEASNSTRRQRECPTGQRHHASDGHRLVIQKDTTPSCQQRGTPAPGSRSDRSYCSPAATLPGERQQTHHDPRTPGNRRRPRWRQATGIAGSSDCVQVREFRTPTHLLHIRRRRQHGDKGVNLQGSITDITSEGADTKLQNCETGDRSVRTCFATSAGLSAVVAPNDFKCATADGTTARQQSARPMSVAVHKSSVTGVKVKAGVWQLSPAPHA